MTPSIRHTVRKGKKGEERMKMRGGRVRRRSVRMYGG